MALRALLLALVPKALLHERQLHVSQALRTRPAGWPWGTKPYYLECCREPPAAAACPSCRPPRTKKLCCKCPRRRRCFVRQATTNRYAKETKYDLPFPDFKGVHRLHRTHAHHHK